MTDPVRLYSPNPNAPTMYGGPDTPRNALTQTMARRPPINALWESLPPAARQAYQSLAQTVADMSTGAAVRDSVNESGNVTNALLRGDGWGAAGSTAGMLAAAAGVIPGSALANKLAKELPGMRAPQTPAMVAPETPGIRAYHGSPHDFDRFDMSKIGTGEGAQAYGHGLYFAGNERVAKTYRDTLGGDALYINGKQVKPSGAGEEAVLSWMRSAPSDVDPYAWARRHIAAERGAGDASMFSRSQLNEAEQALTRLFDSGAKAGPGGRMYEVKINADPNAFLDWDKPLSGQSANVQKLAAERFTPSATANDIPGSTIYRALLGAYDPQHFASDALREAGIPGIKYLDGGSRAAGDGSRNYVVFDDKLIEILRKYGLLPVAAGTAAATLPQEGEAY